MRYRLAMVPAFGNANLTDSRTTCSLFREGDCPFALTARPPALGRNGISTRGVLSSIKLAVGCSQPVDPGGGDNLDHASRFRIRIAAGGKR